VFAGNSPCGNVVGRWLIFSCTSPHFFTSIRCEMLEEVVFCSGLA
jgi:hypothetical protein